MKYPILFTVLALAAGNLNSVEADNRCDGDACGVVTNTWDQVRQRHVFHNASDRRVKVVVEGVWSGSNEMHISPYGSELCWFQAFRMPYHAYFE